MDVSIMYATPNPIETMSLAAGISYGKDNVSLNRVKSCLKHRHLSVSEFGDIQFKIVGISRSCSHQLVRHRLCSFIQESQRYNRYKLDTEDWYVIPESIKNDPKKLQEFRGAMAFAANEYRSMLEDGINPEDARYVLPESTKTTICVKMNAREFFNFLNLRLSPAAQKEIRDLATTMKIVVTNYNEEWKQIMEIYDTIQDIIV